MKRTRQIEVIRYRHSITVGSERTPEVDISPDHADIDLLLELAIAEYAEAWALVLMALRSG